MSADSSDRADTAMSGERQRQQSLRSDAPHESGGRLGGRVCILDALGHIKATFDSIDEATEAAESGDGIVADAGCYTGDVYIKSSLVLTGANAGIAGSSVRRGTETLIIGRLIAGKGAANVTIDGLAIVGGIRTDLASGSTSRLVIKNCVVDGRKQNAAVALLNGGDTTLDDNRIVEGEHATVWAPQGFGALTVTRNYIHAAEQAAAISLNAAAGIGGAIITRNTITGGDYGVSIDVVDGFGNNLDAIAIEEND